MSLFDRKPRRETSTPKQQKPQITIAISSDERQIFEQLCRDLQVRFAVKLADDGLYDYTYDADRDLEISRYFSPVLKEAQKISPSLPKEKKMDLNDRINQTMRKPITLDASLTTTTSVVEKMPPVVVQLQKPAVIPAPPTEIENRWAEQKLAEELMQIKAEIQGADRLLNEKTEMNAMQIMAEHGDLERKSEVSGKQKTKRKSLGRTNQIKTRLTDAEMVQFQRRLKKSGLAQGDFLRSVALTGQIVIKDHSVADVAMLDELAMIRSELGRQGGLLKMIIKPNEGQRELAPEEWAELIATVRDMERMKKRLSDIEVRVQRGHREAQNQ